MLIKIPMTKGEKKRRITECNPSDQLSTSILSTLYPHTAWLNEQTFDTKEFVLFVSDQALGDEVAVKLLPLPYARPAGRHTRFEIQDGTDRNIRTSMEHPVTYLVLRTSELDHAIIAEKKSIYLGVGPAEKPVVIIDPPEATGVDTTVVECPPVETTPDESDPQDGSQGEPVAGIKRIEHDLTDKELASKYLGFFLHHHVRFSRGSRLTSKQLWAAIDANAPDGVRADLLDLRVVTTAVRKTFGIVMDRTGERTDGKNQKFWQDYEVRICYPDPLERSWYDKKSR